MSEAPKRNLKTLASDIDEKVYALSMLFGLDIQDDGNSALAEGVNVTLNTIMEKLVKIDDGLDSIVKAATNTSDLLG